MVKPLAKTSSYCPRYICVSDDTYYSCCACSGTAFFETGAACMHQQLNNYVMAIINISIGNSCNNNYCNLELY